MKRQILGLGAVATIVLSACGGSASPTPAESTSATSAPSTAASPTGEAVKIGFAGPQTGDQAEFGKFTVQAVQLAVEDWNSRGGINGRPIELIVDDDRADPNQTVIVAQRLISQGILGMIGPGNSGTFIPASLEFEKAKIPEIGGAVSNPTITERGLKYAFRVNPRDDVLAPYAADWARRQGWNSVAIITDKSAYGEGQATQFRTAFEAGGGTVVMFEGTNLGDTDFSGVLTKAKGLSPDFLYCGCNANHSGYVVRQAKQLAVAKEYLIGDSGPGFDNVAAEARDGVYNVQNLTPSDFPENAGWMSQYEERWGEQPAVYSHMYYAAADVLFYAMQEVGFDGTAVADYLHSLKDYKSVFGTIEFDQKGDNVKAELGMFKIPASGYPYTLIERKNDVAP